MGMFVFVILAYLVHANRTQDERNRGGGGNPGPIRGGGGGGRGNPGLNRGGKSGVRVGDLPALPSTAEPPPGSIVGKNLSQFKWVDSLVVPRGAAPEIPNITQVAPGVFRYVLRMGRGWHDGDRHLTHGRYAVKGRAELTSLGGGAPMQAGETWLIGSTLMFDPSFVPSNGYCQLAQPVLHQSFFNWDLRGNVMVGQLRVFERGLGSASRLVREVSVRRGEWLTWTLKVRFGPDGYYGLSINGDEFRGIDLNTEIGHVHGAQVGKVSQFGGTWGLYMIMDGPPRDCVVYHANPFLKKIE